MIKLGLLVNPEDVTMTLGMGLINALVGILVVFFILFLLCLVITVFGKLFSVKKPAPAAAAAPVSTPAAEARPEKVLVECDDKTAAMLLAIVADASGIAPEKLCVDYIKCVEE